MFGRLRSIGAIALLLPMGSCVPVADAGTAVPVGYSTGYAETIDAADREGVLRIWSTTDRQKVSELLAGFRQLYPRIRLIYSDMPATELHQRFLADVADGQPGADLLWSSAMDLQIKLVNDGYAQSYDSPEKAALPSWANWKNQAWGITAEPIVMIYNRRLMTPAAMPASHLGLRQLLEMRSPGLKGKVATYDPTKSAVGYLYLSQDDGASRDIWRTIRAFSSNDVRLFATTEAIIDDVSAGRAVVGYNVVGSYALDEMRRNPDLAVIMPSDYTLIMSRIAMIPAKAQHPHAARLFLDYLMSRAGQQHLAAHSMSSVRSDIATPASLRSLDTPKRAIRVGPALLVLQDDLTRRSFMRNWRKAIDGGSADRSIGPT